MASDNKWTLDVIRKARPRSKESVVKALYSEEKIDLARKSHLNTKANFVHNIMEFPYQSTGRLFFMCQGKSYVGSAFVADWGGDHQKNVLITAAHNLYYYADKRNKCHAMESTDIVFVPAMRNNTDLYGPFGRFYATAIGWNNQWNPDEGKDDDEYDIGIIRVGKQYVREGECTREDVGDLVTPITVCYNQVNADTVWKTVGYPVRENNPEDKMMAQKGVYVPNDDSHAISSKISLYRFGCGSSGGPWLLDNDEANGIKVSEDDDLAHSPRFTKALLAMENIHMSTTYGAQ